jgi:hypothetical protein
MIVLGCDPGTTLSAFCVMDSEDMSRILDKGKVPNEELIGIVRKGYFDVCVVECFRNYGMGVGASTFETAYFIGRIMQVAGEQFRRIYRSDVKMNICYTMKAKDSNIRRALIDRFAVHDKGRGTGTKKNKDFFYGVSADIWSAVAIAVTYIDTLKQQPCNERVTKES